MKEVNFDWPGYVGSAQDLDPTERVHKLRQLNTKGFDDTYWWNFDYTIAKFSLMILKVWKQNYVSYPAHFQNEADWEKVMGRAIASFEGFLKHTHAEEWNKEFLFGFEFIYRYCTNNWEDYKPL